MYNSYYATIYSSILLLIQFILSIFILTNPINYISYIIGFFICLMDFPKCIIMRQYKCISDNNSLDSNEIIHSFEQVGTHIINFDYICSFICLFSYTHLLFTHNIPQTIIFLIMAFHNTDIQIKNDVYIKNLNNAISIMIYFVVLYFNISRVLFFIIIMNIFEN